MTCQEHFAEDLPRNSRGFGPYSTLANLCKTPLPSRADRIPSRCSQGSGRGVMVSPLSYHVIYFESDLERKILFLLLTRRDVVAVMEQQKVSYTDPHWGNKEHTFDFVVRLANGRTVAIAVRHSKLVRDLRRTLRIIAGQARDFADDYLLLTEKHISPCTLYNAALVLSARNHPRPDHDNIIRSIAASLHGSVKIADLVAASGLDGDAFRSVVRLIDTEELRLVGQKRITLAALVRRSSAEVEGVGGYLETQGARVALPIVVKKGQPLLFRAWRQGERLERGVWNIPYPADGESVRPDILLAPLVGFDRASYRLGYGGGFFDRTLAALDAPAKPVGVGYSQAELPTIHPQSHDIAMKMIVTEAFVIGPP